MALLILGDSDGGKGAGVWGRTADGAGVLVLVSVVTDDGNGCSSG